jgi:cytosine/adenosine deaminase-related metal-dependent hydrolase
MAETLNSWTLSGARIALDAGRSKQLDLRIEDGRIAGFGGASRHNPKTVDLRGCLILPGLINGHDHLEFSLFPRLGHGPYSSARAWAEDIYRPDSYPIKKHLQVPLNARLLWGGIRNLLSGVTTVCHHNPHYRIFRIGFPVRVARRLGWAHSLDFAPDLAERFRRTPRRWPFVVHLGEAMDERGKLEVFELDKLGVLDDRTVLVHAVALNGAGAALVRARGAALVCCPSSNLFLLGRTLRRATLDSGIVAALGTDSALTCAGDLLDELKVARKELALPLRQLYGMVTTEAAGIFNLKDGEGKLVQGGVADIFVVRDGGLSPAATLLSLQRRAMRLVMVAGEIKLVSGRMAPRLPTSVVRQLQTLMLKDKGEYCTFLVSADVPQLLSQAESIVGPVRLAGRRVHAGA